MKFRLTAPTLLLASLCGAVLMSAPLVTAPAAHAACTAGQTYDPSTGVCWSQASPNQSITGTGGVCLPGRLGLCMAGVAELADAGCQPASDARGRTGALVLAVTARRGYPLLDGALSCGVATMSGPVSVPSMAAL